MGTKYGSNEQLYLDYIEELEENKNEIINIHLSLYLFNNLDLYQKLCVLAKNGVNVTVTSIPLSGYNDKKIATAKQLYSKILEDNLITLKIFPHQYQWFEGGFAGSGASFSFHLKAGIIEYNNKQSKVFISSGNFALADPTHSETAIFLKLDNESQSIKNFKLFFTEIEKLAYDYRIYQNTFKDLDNEGRKITDFIYIGKMNGVDLSINENKSTFFTGPFIKYGGMGSNHYARKRLVDLIKNTNVRLMLCTQHSHDLSPFDGYMGDTLIGAISKIKATKPKVDIRILKQVSSSGLSDKRRASFVESHLYYRNIPQKVNRLVHDKFLIADNTVMISSGNFTATQFGWGERSMSYKTSITDIDKVKKIVEKVKKFYEINDSSLIDVKMTRPRKKKAEIKITRNDIFSEVNSYIIIENKDLAESLVAYFNSLWDHPLTQDVEIPF